MVVLQSVLFHLLLHVFRGIEDGVDLALANAVGVSVRNGLVDELSFLLKQVFVATDYRAWAQLHVEVLLAIGFRGKPDSILANVVAGSDAGSLLEIPVDHEDLLLYLFTLLEDVVTLREEARLQCLAELDHELRVDAVRPFVVLGQTIGYLLLLRLQELEVYSEHRQEVLEKEVFKDFGLDVDGELAHDLLVVFLRDCAVLVILPVVGKMSFELVDHLPRQRLVPVKVLQHPKESEQHLRLLVLTGNGSDFEEDVEELVHDPRKDEHARDQHEGDEKALDFTLWVVVAQTHRRQRRENVVDDDQ